jgi:hypothetical protein
MVNLLQYDRREDATNDHHDFFFCFLHMSIKKNDIETMQMLFLLDSFLLNPLGFRHPVRSLLAVPFLLGSCREDPPSSQCRCSPLL